MPTVIPSRRTCPTCNVNHINAHPDSAPKLFALGLNHDDVKALLSAGDDCSRPEAQPSHHRQVGLDDEAVLTGLGLTPDEVESLRLEALVLSGEDDLDPAYDPPVLTEDVPAEVQAMLSEALREERKRTKSRERQRRWYERRLTNR